MPNRYNVRSYHGKALLDGEPSSQWSKRFEPRLAVLVDREWCAEGVGPQQRNNVIGPNQSDQLYLHFTSHCSWPQKITQRLGAEKKGPFVHELRRKRSFARGVRKNG